MSRLLIFGYGFTGRSLVRRLERAPSPVDVRVTSRDPQGREALVAQGLDAIDPGDPKALARAVADADAILIAAPPGEHGCPGLAALTAHLTPARPTTWIGYLSTTGVYGDRGGGWVREDTPPSPASPEGRRRLAAEQAWRALAQTLGAPLFVFRLPGIYGPGRSALDRVREGGVRRWVKPGQVFSRIHVDDLADALARAWQRPTRAGLYNLCDDEPSAPSDVTALACRLLGVEPPPEEPLIEAALSPMARRFWAESKRVSNAKAKAALEWRPAFPTYREGLRATLRDF